MLVPPNIHKYRDSSDCINRQTKSPTQLLTNTLSFYYFVLSKFFIMLHFIITYIDNYFKYFLHFQQKFLPITTELLTHFNF